MSNLILRMMHINTIVLFAVLVAACNSQTIKVESIKEQSINNYKHLKSINGLSVALQPITRKDDVIKYFGINLIENGVYPIYVTIENQTNSSFQLQLENMAFDGKKNISGGDAVQTMPSAEERAASAAAGYIFIGAASLTALFKHEPAKLINIRHNLRKISYRNQTISPGKKGSGFIYFTTPKQSSSSTYADVSLEVFNINEKSNVHFNFTIQLNPNEGA